MYVIRYVIASENRKRGKKKKKRLKARLDSINALAYSPAKWKRRRRNSRVFYNNSNNMRFVGKNDCMVFSLSLSLFKPRVFHLRSIEKNKLYYTLSFRIHVIYEERTKS